MTENTDGNRPESETGRGGPPAQDSGGAEGVIPPQAPTPLAVIDPNLAAVDRMLAVEAQKRALDPKAFKARMQGLASDPAVIARVESVLTGVKQDGTPLPVKPETFLQAWKEVKDTGYGRPGQSIDVTSGGDSVSVGVVFLPVILALPPSDDAGALVIDADDAEKGLVSREIGDPARSQAEDSVRAFIESGRASGELPR